MNTPKQKSPARLAPMQGFTAFKNTHGNHTVAEAVQQFRAAMVDRGIDPPVELVADGAIHRCDVHGKKGKGDAAYVLHLDVIPAGGFTNWCDGLGWQNWRAGVRQVSPQDVERFRQMVEITRQQRERETEDKEREAAKRAIKWFRRSPPADQNHIYLTPKYVNPLNARQSDGVLLVPLINIDGALVNLQRVFPDGKKRFLYGGQITRAFSLIGDIDPEGCLYVCEGWATGATIHQHTGDPVACAMNCGNLLPVTTVLRARYPNLEITIAGDDDRQTTGNPGRTKATEAAIKTRSKLVFPEFCRTDCECSDFNDLHCCSLAGGVR